MQAPKSTTPSPVFKRLDRLRRSQGITWNDVAQKLGVTAPMLMMVKSGSRNLGPKVLAKLEWAELEAGLRPATKLSEDAKAFGKRTAKAPPRVTENDILNGFFDFEPAYNPDVDESSVLPVVRLTRPGPEGRTRLSAIVGKTFEFEIVILACLPAEQRNESFLEKLTFSSRNVIRDTAMALVFGLDWRTSIANLAVESRIGTQEDAKKLLG